VRFTPRARQRAAAAAGAGLLLLAMLLGVGPSPAAVGAVPSGAATVAPVPVTISGVDLHDGQMQRFGSTYYLYGTMYNCGYTWRQISPGTPWCGFGVSTATNMAGPWSTPTLLFSASAPDPYYAGHTYQSVCGSASGSGCFSPRMIQRSGWGANDNVYVLWFNAPAYMNAAFGSAPHGYMIMGCNGPAGPCGASAGAPYGSTHRPVLHQCNGANGDAGISASVENNALALVCPMAGETSLSIEQISQWGADGTGVGSANVAGLSHVEATGTYRDASGTWVMTYGDPNCGYCTGGGTGYATAPALLGPWTAPVNLAAAGAPVSGRRAISATTCGGQADTITVMDGQAWQKIDLWRGTANEAGAGLHFEPLTYNPSAGTGTAGDGALFRPPFEPWTCS